MFQDVDWSNAAIIGAFIGGGFALAKEVVTFLLAEAKGALAEHRRRGTLKARLAQLYFQTATGAWKALGAWQAACDQLDQLELPKLAQPPSLDFLAYDDPSLLGDLVVLSDEAPQLVTGLIQLREARDTLARAYESERAEFGEVPFFYSFPRTRRLILGVMEHCVVHLRAVSELLPENPWDPDRGSKKAFLTAAGNLERGLRQVPVVSNAETQAELLKALQQRHAAPTRMAPTPKGSE